MKTNCRNLISTDLGGYVKLLRKRKVGSGMGEMFYQRKSNMAATGTYRPITFETLPQNIVLGVFSH